MSVAQHAAAYNAAIASSSRKPEDWVLREPTDDINKYYKFGRELGQPGQFGRACLVTNLQTGQERAVKIISKAKFPRAADRKIHFNELRTEIEIMQKMKHENIITLFDVYETTSDLYIVMEVCSGGELFDRIKAQPDGAYNEKDAAVVLRQICQGLAYLHSNRIAHCDLKPDNFLFVDARKEAPLKIIDFGMSKYVKRRHYFKSLRGTPYYIAPEVIRGHYSEHCDMWSLGVVMFVMIFGYPPFHADNDNEIFRLVLQGFDPVVKKGFRAHFPADIPCSAAAKDLIAKLLTMDTAKRLTAQEALEHPWMTGAEASSTPMLKTVITNLKHFTANNKFKNNIVRLMTNTLTTDELAELKKAFHAIDEDGSGTITAAELAKAIEKTGGSAKVNEIEALLKMADVDGDGVISYEELVMTSVHKKLSAKEERLWNAFNAVDINRDGKLSPAEIEAAFGGEDAETVKQMIKEVDVDGDGHIDFEEFIAMWMKKEEGAATAADIPMDESKDFMQQ